MVRRNPINMPLDLGSDRYRIHVRNIVLRKLVSGALRGYRLIPFGWWRVLKISVLEHEKEFYTEAGLQPPETARRA